MVKAKLRFIDCLRGVAIFGVLLRHLAETVPMKQLAPQFDPYFRAGQYGVQLFFVVSAFTLFLSLDRRRVSESRPWRNYFIRRFFRIAPMFWAALIFYLCFPIGPGESDAVVSLQQKNLPAIAATALFVNSCNPHWINSIIAGEWSVATEMLFYLLVPLFFLAFKSVRRAMIVAILLTGMVLVLTGAAWVITEGLRWHNPMLHRAESRALYKVSHSRAMVPDRLASVADRQELWRAYLYFWLPNQLPVFALGIVLFYLYHALGEPGRRTEEDVGARAPPGARRRQSYLLFLVALAMLMWLPTHQFRYIPPHLLFGVAAVVLACALAIHEIPLLVNPFWQYLGKISYSVYLTHWAIMWPLAKWISPTIDANHFSFARLGLILALELPLAMLVATVTFHLIEQPGQELGRRLIRRLESRSPVQPVLTTA